MSTERGRIVEPPPNPRATPPSHRYKWYKMMGATDLLPRHILDEERRLASSTSRRFEKIWAEQEQRNAKLRAINYGPERLRIADRYALGRLRKMRRVINS